MISITSSQVAWREENSKSEGHDKNGEGTG
jgi:hypothetical protein